MLRLLGELQRREDLSPTIDGYVLPPDLRLRRYGSTDRVVAPPGFAKVERWDHAKLWRIIRNNGIDARVLVGIDDTGKLEAWPQAVFVPTDQLAAVNRVCAPLVNVSETAEQRDAREREAGILKHRPPPRRWVVRRHAARGPRLLAVRQSGYAHTLDGVEGYLLSIEVFVSNEQVQAHRAAGEAAYQAELDAHAAEEPGA